MGMTSGGGKGSISAINVTPLVDVMLVLLIIFMVTATLARPKDEQEREVDMNLPRTPDQPVPVADEQDLILHIDNGLVVKLGEDLVVDCSAALTSTERERFETCFEAIQTRVTTDPRVLAQGSLYILADLNVPYGFVVGSLHRIGLAGVENVGMVTNREFLSLAPPPTATETTDGQ